MSTQYLTRMEEPPVPRYDAAEMAQGLYVALARFLAPLLMVLDDRLEAVSNSISKSAQGREKAIH